MTFQDNNQGPYISHFSTYLLTGHGYFMLILLFIMVEMTKVNDRHSKIN